jgi:hypothetical protein
MAPKRPHPLATSTLPSPSRRRARPRPSYGNESDEASDIDLASEDDDASDDDDTAVGSARAPAAAAAAAPTSEDVLLLGSEDEESSPLTSVKVLEKRIVAEPRRSSAASPAPVTTTAAARRVQARPRASTATSTTASHRRSSPSTSSGGGGATGRRVSSTVQQEPETGSGRRPALVLPLPLVSYVLERLLQPDVLPSLPAASTALPAFSGRLTAAWSLIRHALSPVGGGSTLSPREEVELRRLEGWVGLRVLRESTGGSDAQGRHATADDGRELERGLAKAVRPGLAGASCCCRADSTARIPHFQVGLCQKVRRACGMTPPPRTTVLTGRCSVTRLPAALAPCAGLPRASDCPSGVADGPSRA